MARSLDPSEARGFRRRMGANLRHGENNSLALFDFLTGRDTLLAEDLDRWAADNGMGRTLGVNLTRLEAHLLDYLTALRQPSPAQEARNLTLHAEILLSRGLLPSSARVLRRAKALALRHHLSHELLQIGVVEKALIFRLRQKEVTPNLQELLQRDQDALHALREVVACQGLAVQAHAAAKLGATAALPEVPRPSHPLALLHWLQAQGTAALHLGDFSAASRSFEEMAALSLAHADDFPGHDATVALTNYLGACLAGRRLAAAQRALELMQGMRPSSRYEAMRLRENLLYAQQIYFLNVGDFARAAQLAEEVERFISQAGNLLPTSKVLSLRYNTGIAFFAQGEWSRSLAMLNRIYQAGRLEYRRDVQNAVRLLRLPLHMELGNHDLVESMARSLQREWGREGWPGKGERRILQFLQNAARLPDDDTALAKSASLLERHIQEEQLMDAGPGYREFTFWLRAKATDRPILDIFCEELQGQQGNSESPTE